MFKAFKYISIHRCILIAYSHIVNYITDWVRYYVTYLSGYKYMCGGLMQNSACPSNHILLAWFSGNGVAGQLIHSYYST